MNLHTHTQTKTQNCSPELVKFHAASIRKERRYNRSSRLTMPLSVCVLNSGWLRAFCTGTIMPHPSDRKQTKTLHFRNTVRVNSWGLAGFTRNTYTGGGRPEEKKWHAALRCSVHGKVAQVAPALLTVAGRRSCLPKSLIKACTFQRAVRPMHCRTESLHPDDPLLLDPMKASRWIAGKKLPSKRQGLPRARSHLPRRKLPHSGHSGPKLGKSICFFGSVILGTPRNKQQKKKKHDTVEHARVVDLADKGRAKKRADCDPLRGHGSTRKRSELGLLAAEFQRHVFGLHAHV